MNIICYKNEERFWFASDPLIADDGCVLVGKQAAEAVRAGFEN